MSRLNEVSPIEPFECDYTESQHVDGRVFVDVHVPRVEFDSLALATQPPEELSSGHRFSGVSLMINKQAMKWIPHTSFVRGANLLEDLFVDRDGSIPAQLAPSSDFVVRLCYVPVSTHQDHAVPNSERAKLDSCVEALCRETRAASIALTGQPDRLETLSRLVADIQVAVQDALPLVPSVVPSVFPDGSVPVQLGRPKRAWQVKSNACVAIRHVGPGWKRGDNVLFFRSNMCSLLFDA